MNPVCGLLSEAIAESDPDEPSFRAHERRMRAQLRPRDEYELSIIDRIIACEWRLRRLVAIEARLLADRVARTGEIGEAAAYGHHQLNGGIFATLTKHLGNVERSLGRAQRELRLHRAHAAKKHASSAPEATSKPPRLSAKTLRENADRRGQWAREAVEPGSSDEENQR